MRIKITFIDSRPERVFNVTSMGAKDGFLTFSTDGPPLENGEPTLDFVYSVQAHLVREIENVEPEVGERVFKEMLDSTPSMPSKPVKEETK